MTRRRDPDRVPVAPLRDAYLASSLTLTEVCVSLGWFRESPSKGGPYTSQLARALGLRATKNVNHNTGVVYCSTQLTISKARALAICEALDVDFDVLYEGKLPSQKARGGRCVTCGELLARPVRSQMCGFCLAESEFGSDDSSRRAA